MKKTTSKSACRVCTGDIRVSRGRGPRACVCPDREERAAVLPSRAVRQDGRAEKKHREYEALVVSGRCINCRDDLDAEGRAKGVLRCSKCRGSSTRQRFARAANKVRDTADWDKLRCRRLSPEQVAEEMTQRRGDPQQNRQEPAGSHGGSPSANGEVVPSRRANGSLVLW